jgi:osmotically-inducible protein OsmY
MNIRLLFSASLIGIVMAIFSGCAVSRVQETVGSYVDGAGITTRVKTQLLDNKNMSGTSISVKTHNGTVMLSRFAKNTKEKDTAEQIAQNVKDVKAVTNKIDVKP